MVGAARSCLYTSVYCCRPTPTGRTADEGRCRRSSVGSSERWPYTTRRATHSPRPAPPQPPPNINTTAASACTAMKPGAWRRACVEFRAKLSRDTSANLPAAVCEELLATTFDGGHVSLQSNPGLFYACLGEAIADEVFAPDLQDRSEVTCWCYREAAEVHAHPGGMNRLAACYYMGIGVTEDPPQAAVWFQKAADLGEAGAKAAMGGFLVYGDEPSGVHKDVARGFELLREAVELGLSEALFPLAHCYLAGDGVEKDAAHGVALLRQAVEQSSDEQRTMAQTSLAKCYYQGEGVEADTVQAVLWCQRGAQGGEAEAIELLPVYQECDLCGSSPARQLCSRCRKVRYCNAACQRAHWNRETYPHKRHCRRAAEASEEGTTPGGGASSPSAS